MMMMTQMLGFMHTSKVFDSHSHVITIHWTESNLRGSTFL